MKDASVKIHHWLYPLSWLYGAGVCLRNKLFDWGWLRSRSFDVPVICVGNIAVGGTGKTPHTEYLIKLLQNEGINVATLSRGYKRKSKGYILATAESSVQKIGDEPYQIKSKFPDIRVAVDENRCHGIEQLLTLKNPAVDAVLLDDAFQHRHVKAGMNILLTDYHRLLCDDALLPAGRLREPACGIVTKCPDDIKPIDFNIITKRLNLYPYQQLYFSRFRYGSLMPLFPEKAKGRITCTGDEQVLLVTGIASPAPLVEEVKSYTSSVSLLEFGDHHDFGEKDLLLIEKQFNQLKGNKRLIITTEKDATRLKNHPNLNETLKPYIYVLPIEIEFLQNQQYILAMLERIQETAAYLKGKMHTHPETAIILGTGLGSLAGEITEKYEIKYEDIPNFPVSTVEGHSGKLIFGKLGNKDIMAMQGRFHFYEGYSMKEVTFPVRVMRELGIKTLFVSNASGGTNPDFEIGDLMIITDHINFFPEHPLHGRNIPYGPRFPDMSEAYDKELIRKADAIAAEKGIKVQHGVYIGTQGPTFETPAEYKMFRILGADAVGMSTVPEVIVANHCGIKVFGVSVITDLGVEGKIVEVSHEEVQKAADAAQPKMTEIMRELIK